MSNSTNSFHGREDEIKTLDDLFKNNPCVVICGTPGIGKTELAHFYAKTSNYNNIIFLNGKNPEKLRQSFRRTAIYLNLYNQTVDLHYIIRYIYSYYKDEKTLFIIDDVKDYENIDGLLPTKLEYSKFKISVLITSQSINWNENILKLYLQPVDSQVSLQIFKDILDENLYHSVEQNEIVELANYFENIPLCLYTAAKYVQVLARKMGQQFSFRQYSEELRQYKFEFTTEFSSGYRYSCLTSSYNVEKIEENNAKKSEDSVKIDRENNYKELLYVCLGYNIQKLKECTNEEGKKLAFDILQILAYLDPDYITRGLLEELDSVTKCLAKLDNAISVLENYGLLNVETKTNKYYINPSVQNLLRLQHKKLENVEHFEQTLKWITNFYIEDSLYLIEDEVNMQYTFLIKDFTMLKRLLESSSDVKEKIRSLMLLHGAFTSKSLDTVIFLVRMGAGIQCSCEMEHCQSEIIAAFFMYYFSDVAIEKEYVTEIDGSSNRDLVPDMVQLKGKGEGFVPEIYENEEKNSVTQMAQTKGSDNDFSKPEIYKCENKSSVQRREPMKKSDNYSASNSTKNNTLVSQARQIKKTDNNHHIPEMSRNRNFIPESAQMINNKSFIPEILQLFWIYCNDPKIKQLSLNTILHMATKWRNPQFLKYLLSTIKVPDVNYRDSQGWTPIFYAVNQPFTTPENLNRTTEIIQLLLSHEALLNIEDNEGNSILHYAARYGCPSVLNQLIHKDISVLQMRNRNGQTPLFWCQQMDIIDVLVTAGGNIYEKDNDDRTILHYCASQPDKIRHLCDKFKMDVNATDKDGNTVLHVIVIEFTKYMNDTDTTKKCITELLARGADIKIKNNQRQTPAHRAALNEDFPIRLVPLLKPILSPPNFN